LASPASAILATQLPKQRLFPAIVHDPPPTPVLLGPLEAKMLRARVTNGTSWSHPGAGVLGPAEITQGKSNNVKTKICICTVNEEIHRIVLKK
jgi:hypothetical protein